MKQCSYPLALLFACLFWSGLAEAQAGPPYIAQMPDAERVRADVQGSDRLDTLARQKAAFEQLFRAVEIAAGSRLYSGLTPAEQRWRDAYRGAADAVRTDAYSGLSNTPPGGLNPFAKSPLQQWNALTAKYERDARGRDTLLRRYFSDDAYATLTAALAQDAADRNGDIGLAQRFGIPEGAMGPLGTAVLGLVLVTLVVLAVREFRPLGLSPLDPLLLRTGFRSRRLEWTTGRVLHSSSRGERDGMPSSHVFRDMDGTVTHSGGSVKREKTTEYIVLAGADGKQHHFQLINSDIKLTEGHVATAVCVADMRHTDGDVIFFFDHSAAHAAARPVPVNKALARLIGVGRVIYLPAIVLAFLLGSAVSNVVTLGNEGVIGFIGMAVGGFGAASALILVTGRRVRRFMRNEAPRILAEVAKAEGAWIATARESA